MVILSEVSSSSSSNRDHRYDVFLSFRGFDMRLSFTDHLYSSLINANITTFLDDEEIDTGEDLKPELESAIKASRASIIVLSKNYASSTWCLDELVLILEQHRNSDHIVIPVFYHVEPTDVRKQQNSFEDSMTKHKQKMETCTDAEKRSQLAQKMKLWNRALTEIADLKGKSAENRKETEFIEEIVTEIHRRLGVPSSIIQPLPIGMEYHVIFIASWLKNGSSHSADILTIVGMSGIGKTTLAKYVFGLHFQIFDKSSFIEDIGRRCVEKYSGLLELQKQLCGDISKTSSMQVHDASVYTFKIEKAFARKKVFLVLDGVDSLDHLDALLGNKGFHPGSKIIITTQYASLTNRCALFNPIVQPKHLDYLLRGLGEYDSLTLLSFHAFMCNKPREGYEEVSDKLVEYCEGHPLALQVLGRSLRNRDVAEWKDYIESLKAEPDSYIQKILRMSFDALPSKNDKELFKHIACFFVGKERGYVEAILNACGLHIVFGIRNLINRCLIIIRGDNELTMHQLIQEMGRDVVRQESPDKSWKRSRLWCHEESFKVLKQKKGKGNLLGIALDMRMLEKDKLHGPVKLKTNALSKMDNLMLLQLNYVQLNGSYGNFPEELRWLCMHGFPLESIPLELPMKILVALDMSYSNFKSFDISQSDLPRPEKRQKVIGSCSNEERLLKSLKILNLSFCTQLSRLGGFFELPKLERLILANCIGLMEICGSIENCDELVLIDLSYCREFRKLLTAIGKLRKVKTLLLDGCNIGEFSSKKTDVEHLEIVKEDNIGINSQTSFSAIVEAIPRDVGSFVISIPSSLVCLSLTDNHLSNESFPMDFSGLSMLKDLYLDRNQIASLPNCVRSLPRLEKLSLDDCHWLRTLEHPPHTLKHLIFNYLCLLQKVVFHQDMSPLMLTSTHYGSFIEGVFKVEDMGHINQEVLRCLGWTDLVFTKHQQVESHIINVEENSQMIYEFGIFSTIYGGMEMPDWISHRSNGSSISFTMPSTHRKLTGLNFCYAFTKSEAILLSYITISNMTKTLSWTYYHSTKGLFPVPFPTTNNVIVLTHWMFGKNEMEDGDQIETVITKENEGVIKECGISLVYDDGRTEENPLGYYKSWNHIIGGDLSAFEVQPRSYLLERFHFFGRGSPRHEGKHPMFRAFS